MRLKRLELQGFKSFLDRTILSFDDSITGVVGPNGCGKSNIVDAILWVMGEQSPKHLRGDAMTDVIFNGSEGKSAVSMAEVSLVLDKQGVPLAPQFSMFDRGEEISITRRIYRDGSGEYLINKTRCRLKDIHELFMDTGVGRRAYSIIEQGQIDRMINVKPEERRLLFEEVAGITKYKLKRKEAERKLENTRQNLVRLQDIINELEKRIRSLKVQASRAKKYKELKSELETVDLYLLGRALHSHRREIEQLERHREEVEARRSESDARVAEVDAEITRSEIKRVDEEKALQAHSERERDLSLQIQRLENELNLLEQRRGHLSQAQENSRREEAEITASIEALTAEVQQYDEERRQLITDLEELEVRIAEEEGRLKEIQEEKHGLEAERDRIQFQRNQISQREIRLRNQVENGETREAELVQRRDELNRQLTDIIVSMDQLKARVAEAESRVEACARKREEAEAAAKQIHSECEQTSQRLSELEGELFRLREDYHAKHSRLESLKELQENLEGYSPTAREILLKLEEASLKAQPLPEILQPEPDVEEALESLLSADMNTLLVGTTEEAERLGRLIRERDLERARIVAMAELGGTSPTVAVEGAEPLLGKVKVTPGFEAVAEHWLGNSYLCDDMERLFALRRAHPDKVFVSRDSRTIAHQDRSLTCGNLPTKTGVFARRREIDELHRECQRAEAELAERTAERERLLAHLQEQEGLHAELKDRLSSLHVERVEYLKEKEKVQLELNRADRDYTGLTEESRRVVEQAEKLREEIDLWNRELEAVAGEEQRFQEELAEFAAKLEELATSHAALSAGLGQRREERSRLSERSHGLDFKVNKIRSDITQAESRRGTLLAQRERDEQDLAGIDGQVAEVQVRKEEQEAIRNETLVLIADTKDAFNETCTAIGELRNQLSALQKEREGLVREIQDLQVQLTQKQAALDHLRETAAERYDEEVKELDDNARIDSEKLPLLTSESEVTFELLMPEEQHALLQEHLDNLRKKVSRYGEVNLTAIQEFDEIQQRYDFLLEQRADLEKSIGILEQAIEKINDSTKARFEETFHAVNRKFREIFPILFNGGKAELKLTEAENILDAGVDIMVQPPGKRLQSITLLSGGEKALTAVSLVLAIFARKPSPFCLLDEVDAPLDDANVSRFNTVIRKMAEKTQFIVITHNKKTMEITESLYGVTMERAGVSKMTSVQLH